MERPRGLGSAISPRTGISDDGQQDRVDLLRNGGGYSGTGRGGEMYLPRQSHQLQLHGSLIPSNSMQNAQGPASPGFVRFCYPITREITMAKAFECLLRRATDMWMAALGHRLFRCTTHSIADLEDVPEEMKVGRSRVTTREARTESASRRTDGDEV